MNTNTSNLSKLVIVFTAFLLITFLNCSDDPISPQESKPVDATTIGVDGGTIEKGDLKITIPPGAFDKNYDISVSEVADDGAFGENIKSATYSIAGLPQEFHKPLKIAIKYDGNLSADKFLAIGNEFYNELKNTTSIIYDLFEAIDSAGFIVTELSVISSIDFNKGNSLSTLSADNSKKLASIVDLTKTYETKHFKIKYPILLSQDVVELGETLESVFEIIVKDFHYFNDDSNPVNVVIRHQKESADYCTIQSTDNKYEFTINISRTDLSIKNFKRIKEGIVDVYIDFPIKIFYSRIKNKNWKIENYHWLNAAFFSWAEKHFTDDPNFKYPYYFIENAISPFKGLQFGAGNDEEIYWNHGYGMASLIEYLVENTSFGMEGFIKTYRNITNDIDPLSSLIKNVDGQLVEWLSDFYKKLINNEIYELPKDHFIKNANISWDINGSSDTLKIFNAQDPNVDTYLDLSAKLFKINLNHKPTDESYKMRLTMKGPVTQFGLYLHVWGIQNNETVYLSSISGEYYYEIPNLKNSYDKFLVCLVNGIGNPPYIGKSDIDLKVQIGNNFDGDGGQSDFNFNKCNMEIFVNKLFSRQDGTEFEQESIQPLSASGEMVGNRFLANYNLNSGMFVGTVEATLNESADTIKLLNWTHEYTVSSPSTYQKTEITALDIPIFNQSDGIYKVTGTQTCTKLITYKYYQNFQDDVTTLKSFECNSTSYVEIRLYKQE